MGERHVLTKFVLQAVDMAGSRIMSGFAPFIRNNLGTKLNPYLDLYTLHEAPKADETIWLDIFTSTNYWRLFQMTSK